MLLGAYSIESRLVRSVRSFVLGLLVVSFVNKYEYASSFGACNRRGRPRDFILLVFLVFASWWSSQGAARNT